MAAAALVAGTAISAYGSYESGQDKQQAYELEAQSRRAQAAEVQIGAEREMQLTAQHDAMIEGAQKAAVGASGTTMGGTNLLQLEQTAKNASDQLFSIQNAANYRSSTLLVDAGQSDYLGRESYNAGVLGAVGSGLSGVGSYSRATKGGF